MTSAAGSSTASTTVDRNILRVTSTTRLRPSHDDSLTNEINAPPPVSFFFSVSKCCMIMSRPVSRDKNRMADVVVTVAGESWEH